MSKWTDSEFVESVNEPSLLKTAPWLAPEWPQMALTLGPSPLPELSFPFKGRCESRNVSEACAVPLCWAAGWEAPEQATEE